MQSCLKRDLLTMLWNTSLLSFNQCCNAAALQTLDCTIVIIANYSFIPNSSRMNDSIFSKIKRLDRRAKIFYISSVGLSLALIVFGACVWALTESDTLSSKFESSAAGDATNHNDQSDFIADEAVPLYPTNSPSVAYNRESLPTDSPVLPSITLWPPYNEPAWLRASATPSTYHTTNPSNMPSTNPSGKSSESPSGQPSNEPSPTSSETPSQIPSMKSSSYPTLEPSISSPSLSPTSSSVPSTSAAPSNEPLFPSHTEPIDPDPTYFNYNTSADSMYGPNRWENVTVLNSTENYWHEFGFVENRCGAGTQSPIDLCTEPVKHCMEEHEFRSRPGDYTIDGNMTEKQILPNKLRVVMARRTGDEPDPPHTDFSGIGYRALDMLNIDIKFPSEHTLCGRVYDGEMQYYFFHPVRKALIGIAWLIDAREVNATNNHMQLLIDQFQQIYDSNESGCLYNETVQNVTVDLNETDQNDTIAGNDTDGTARNLKKPKPWDPFHVDIQKTIHFWGYSGSLTEPPCTDSVLWRVMDVPVKISYEQLYQMQNILFNNRNNETCAYTSNHFNGRVARPVSNNLRYYKCTRDDYVSDDERDMCGDGGCDFPFGKDLEPYFEPEIFATGPQS